MRFKEYLKELSNAELKKKLKALTDKQRKLFNQKNPDRAKMMKIASDIRDLAALIKEEDKIEEMGNELNLESGYTITKKTMKKMKKKYKTANEFIKHLKSKVKTLTDKDERRIKAALGEI